VSIEAMKQALEALEDYEPNSAHKAITALRVALSEEAMQKKMEHEPLSIETINKLWNDAVGWGDASSNEVAFVRAIEAMLKEKNP